ncbi:MAG: transporter ATP-binding protein [Firmicutes bacterium]|nr:transporter ATP-binding protein [Bacillota bacterium]
MEQKNRIVTDHIAMSFQDNVVLQDINVKIEEGEIFGLLGPSGAGKTTLIKILTGQLKQISGTAQVLGMDNRSITREGYAKIGMVLDNTGLYDRLTCWDNLALFTEIYGISKDRIKVVLNKVGLEDATKRSVHKLSKGMKQRLALARAIMHEPEILFLDEPTSGLDPATASYIHQLILEEKGKGTAIFLTTHNMEEATKLCDNVALLNKGQIVEYGYPKNICRKYNFQNKIQLLLKNGESHTLTNDSSSAELIGNYFKNNAVESIHSSEPNLETVFMEITGRRFE